jgi:gliding motility-associated-like protein
MKNLTFILLFVCFDLTAQVITITSDKVCEGVATSLSASVNIHDSLIATYLWDLDFDGYFDDVTGKDIQYTFSGSDTFFVKVQLSLNDGQSYISDDYQVVILPLPVASFSESHLCVGDSVTLTNTSTIVNSESLFYNWYVDSDDIIYSENKDLVLFIDGMKQSIKMVVTSNGGCSDSVTKEITLNEKPNSDFNFENSCKYDTVSFINLSTITDGSIAYTVWNFGDSILSISEHPEHVFLSAGIFTVQLISITENNCSDSITKDIEIFELPEAEILAEDTVIFSKDILTLSVLSNANDILWSTGSNENEILIYSEGIYSVRSKDLNECVNADTIKIYNLAINQKVIKSEILTPNGDGINDVLEIKEMFRHYHCQVFVFNEWGQQVYSSTDYQNDWNCFSNSNYLNAGAYYYLIKLNDLSFRGCVNILR